MLCEACGQKEATINVTQVINDVVKKINLCQDCAAANGLDANNPLAVTDVLLGLGGKKEAETEPSGKTCPVCHMRFSDFKKTSRLGCQACYDAFANELAPLLEAMHKGTQHVGKAPVNSGAAADDTSRLAALKKSLDAAVASEDYEEAARLRDRLHQSLEQSAQRRKHGSA